MNLYISGNNVNFSERRKLRAWKFELGKLDKNATNLSIIIYNQIIFKILNIAAIFYNLPLHLISISNKLIKHHKRLNSQVSEKEA